MSSFMAHERELSPILSILLLALCLVSFIPQFYSIWLNANSSGISLYWILFNLLLSTEQFTLHFHYVVDNVEVDDDIVASPPALGDWLNLSQFGSVWACHVVLFVLYLYFPPEGVGSKGKAVAIFFSFLLVSLIPVLLESSLWGSDSKEDRRWFGAIFSILHVTIVNPLCFVLGLLGFYAQSLQTTSAPSRGVLSTGGLAAQAVAFALVALSWPSRMRMSAGFWTMWPVHDWIMWYLLVGWASVSSGIYALSQATLYWIARERG